MIIGIGNMSDFIFSIMKYKNKKFILAVDSDRYNSLFDSNYRTRLKSFQLGGNRVFLLRLDRRDLAMESFLRGVDFSGAYIECKSDDYQEKEKEIKLRLFEYEDAFYIKNVGNQINQSERS